MKQFTGSEGAVNGKPHPVLEAILIYDDRGNGAKGRGKSGRPGAPGKNGELGEIMRAKIRLCGSEEVAPHTDKVLSEKPPSARELAKLASQMVGDKRDINPHRAVGHALELYKAASRVSQAKKQEAELLEGLFEQGETEREKQVDSYVGDLRVLEENHETMALPVDFVLKHLFLGRSETTQSRRSKLLELVQFAHTNGLRLYSKSGESLEVSRQKAEGWLAEEKIGVLTCRWLAVARERQIAQIKEKAGRRG